MVSSKLETLPDEVLMIILQYSGDIFSVFRAFLGLNQRINMILIDRRTHLLTDFLSIRTGDVNIDYYYNPHGFFEITTKLCSSKSIDDVRELRPYFEQVVAFHLKHQYEQSTNELELGLVHHQSVRMELAVNEVETIDTQLQEMFMSLETSSNVIKTIEEILSLVLTKGARLECADNTPNVFNFAEAVSKLVLEKIGDPQPTSAYFIHSLVRMFKALLTSNLTLLHNRCFGVNGGYVIHYYLFYTIYNCQSIDKHGTPPLLINISYHRAAVEILLFILQCLQYESVSESWRISDFSDLLEYISPIPLQMDQEIFVYVSQVEILKILFERGILNPPVCNADGPDTLWKQVGNIITCNRLDLILTLLHYNEHIHHRFANCWNNSNLINMLIGTPAQRRQILQPILEHPEAGLWLSSMTNLLFILLQKKQCKLIKRFINRFPCLINRLDEEGNDPLLYTCLKVRGCRQRLIEYFLQKGCDTQRRNLFDENFFDAVHLPRNRTLLQKLLDEELISEP